MYRFKCIVLILLLISLPLYCELIEVDIAGNYDYVSIQAAIEEAESGDEILVYPGVYFENVDFLGKQIELKSLFATTGERHYIAETVINGNETGSCVKVVNYEPEGTSITGFTLTGGSGTEFDDTERFYGGGIYSLYSSLSVFSCIIEENAPTISLGGGIAVGLECNMFLSDTIIRNNVVDTFGGGIFFINRENSVIFDQENRCSIYNNYSPRGADIYCWYEGGNTEVYLDTITVEDYEGYYVFQYLEAPPWFYMTGLNIYYENTWMEPIDADLYVSPEGDDENSGLCWDDPLKSITWANQKIAVNPESMHTIYLDEGVYSASTTGEKMPFQLKDNITLSGASPETTIIDAELSYPFMRLSYGHYYFGMENLRFINAASDFPMATPQQIGIHIVNPYYGDIHLENLVFENNYPKIWLFLINIEGNAQLNNIIFLNNGDANAPPCMNLYLWNDSGIHTEGYLNNIISMNNNSGLISLGGRNDNRPDFYVSNMLSTDNFDQHGGGSFEENVTLLSLGSGGSHTYLINSTLANNFADTPTPSTAVMVGHYCSLEVINSIIYNNCTDYQLYSYNIFEDHTINVHHSLIENGSDGVWGMLPFIWDNETNLDCDPMFSDDEEYPLSLLNDSPCIDAGTTQMPEGFTLPETDVYGNPRIYGNGIDIGAVEWQGTPVEYDDIVQKPMDIMVYPNPVISSKLRDGCVKIEYSGEFKNDAVECVIYNVKGQRLRRLRIKNEGLRTNSIFWDTKDESENPVSSGVYFIRIKGGDQFVSQRKVTVVR